MEYRMLGKTGIRVSRLCFGSLTIGPLQANLSVGEGSRLIELALECGVNFIDTAELYGTYPHIRRAIRHRKEKPVLVLPENLLEVTACEFSDWMWVTAPLVWQ